MSKAVTKERETALYDSCQRFYGDLLPGFGGQMIKMFTAKDFSGLEPLYTREHASP